MPSRKDRWATFYFPRTADGKEVGPGCCVYRVHGNPGYQSGEQCGVGVFGVRTFPGHDLSFNGEDWQPARLFYSTRIAAERGRSGS